MRNNKKKSPIKYLRKHYERLNHPSWFPVEMIDQQADDTFTWGNTNH